MGALPQLRQADVPHITIDQMRDVDRQLDAGGVTRLAIAEGAARGLVTVAQQYLDGSWFERHVTVAAGPGGNGAGGWKAARMLLAAGALVTVLQTGPEDLPGTVSHGSARVIQVDSASDLATVTPGDIFLDAMLGFGAAPPLRGAAKVVVDWLTKFDVPIISLDMPSGLDGDTGDYHHEFTATATVAVGLPKHGQRLPEVVALMGDLYLADLGVPPDLWHNAGAPDAGSTFSNGPVVALLVDTANR